MKRTIHTVVSVLLGCLLCCGGPDAQGEATGAQTTTFEDVTAGLVRQLTDATEELRALERRIDEEKRPMSRALAELQSEVDRLRDLYQEKRREVEKRTFDVAGLERTRTRKKDEIVRLSDLFNSYTLKFSANLHVTEAARYEQVLSDARLAPENTNLTRRQVFDEQLALVDASVERLFDALGGTKFEGTALDDERVVREGEFVLVGPAALFRSTDGAFSGAAEQVLNAVEPVIAPFRDPAHQAEAETLVRTGRGRLPFDSTLGDARKVEETEETLVEHAMKGGVIMFPILGMAALALLVALYKWLRLTFVRKPSKKSVAVLLGAIEEDDRVLAKEKARKIGGPVGDMLAAGVEHIDEPKELIEEVLYERVLTAKVGLMSLLPFVAICAAASPLLGLLGTVQGIIETFKQITIHGSGDVKMLSAGISKALITTEFGLIVAIPSLLLHAFLSRKARGILNTMETTAISFVNEVVRARNKELTPRRGDVDDVVREQVKAVLGDLLAKGSEGLADADREQLAARLERALEVRSQHAPTA